MSSPVRLQRPRNLTLGGPKSKARVTFKEDVLPSQTNSSSLTTPSPRKRWCDPEFRAKRKRAHSCSFSWDHVSNKRRKASGAIVLPSKFLLGGNITDPLNLEALDKGDKDKSKEDHVSGGGYKGGGIVQVIIPPNINDPLNLDACSEDGEEQLVDAISRQRRRRKTRKRKRRNSEPGGAASVGERSTRLCTSLDEGKIPLDTRPVEPTATTPELPSTPSTLDGSSRATPNVPSAAAASSNAGCATFLRGFSDPGFSVAHQEDGSPSNLGLRHSMHKKQKTKVEDKIVSPVVPQPGIEKKRHFPHQRHSSNDKQQKPESAQSHLEPPKQFHTKNAAFQYGNYNQYYGYRNLDHKPDPRLKLFKNGWLCGKDVLDIGCNIGHITLCIGRDFGPNRVVGIDIDKKLVKIAQKNVKHYLAESRQSDAKEFPASMKLLYGPLKPPVGKGGQKKFPHNVRFFQSNYVLENDALLETVRPEFDTVLCLSVTKWIHLNFGDEGMKRFFKRAFLNLRPGGILILEPQAWPSYTKKRKLTNEIFENYKNIRLFPSQFGEYLTSEIGFSFVQKSSVAQHYSRGFDRPIYIYRKPSQEEKLSITEKKEELATDNVVVQNCVPDLPSVELALPSVSQEHVKTDIVQDTRFSKAQSPDSTTSQIVESTDLPVANLNESPPITDCPTSLDKVADKTNIKLPKLPSADLPDTPPADLPDLSEENTEEPTSNLESVTFSSQNDEIVVCAGLSSEKTVKSESVSTVEKSKVANVR